MSESAILGLAASLVAGALTGVGGWLVAAFGAPDARRQTLFIGFAAGVMIAAAVFSLILPAIARAQVGGASLPAAITGVAAAVALGALGIAQLGRTIEARVMHNPDHHAVLLIVLAITLHNVPEGMAVGLAFMAGDPQLGWATMLGIGIQNIPEGMAVAAVLAARGWSAGRATLGALATGLVEPLGGAFGVGIAQVAAAALPWALGFSAGAMLFVAMAEMIPHARRRIAHGSATPALLAGLAVMMVLDISLG